VIFFQKSLTFRRNIYNIWIISSDLPEDVAQELIEMQKLKRKGREAFEKLEKNVEIAR
jgi:hypothetical protein